MTEYAKITKQITATEARIKILEDEDLNFYLYPYGEIKVWRVANDHLFEVKEAREFVLKLLGKEKTDLDFLYRQLEKIESIRNYENQNRKHALFEVQEV